VRFRSIFGDASTIKYLKVKRTRISVRHLEIPAFSLYLQSHEARLT